MKWFGIVYVTNKQLIMVKEQLHNILLIQHTLTQQLMLHVALHMISTIGGNTYQANN